MIGSRVLSSPRATSCPRVQLDELPSHANAEESAPRSRAEGETELPEPMWDTGRLLPGHWAHREPTPHGDRRHGMSAADQAMLDAMSSVVEVRAAERAQSNVGRMSVSFDRVSM